MSEVFIEYGHLPEDTRKNLAGLEDLLCDMDGKTLCSDGGEDEQGRPTFVDEGCIVVDDYVSAFNGLVAALTRIQQSNAALVGLVRSAYSEGMSEGMREYTSSKGGKPWSDSNTKLRLSALSQQWQLT